MVKVFREGQIPVKDMLAVEEFRIPMATPLRERELEIDRMYNNRAAYFVKYGGKEVLATARIISKKSSTDKLPIEFSRTVTGLEFPLCVTPPVCEIGGLKVADNLSRSDRYDAITEVLFECCHYVLEKKFLKIFASCQSDVLRFYQSKFSFELISKIFYGNKEFFAISRDIGNFGTPWN